MLRPIIARASVAFIGLAVTSPLTQAQPPAPPASAPNAAGSTPDTEQARFTAAADYSASKAGRAVLVMRDGEAVFERYDHGWSADKPHPLASGTKSFTGVMAMMAVQDGLLTLDEPAADTITEWKSDARKAKITIRQLLQLASGLPAGDRELSAGRSGSALLGEVAQRRAERLKIDENAPKPSNLNTVAIGLPLQSDPGERFRYGPSHFYVFSEVLTRKLKAANKPEGDTLGYLRARVLEPIGIKVARIGRDAAGNPNLPGGMLLTAREWARFGQFVLDRGSVRGPDGQSVNLLRPELLDECFVPSAANPAYGLTWWLRHSAEDTLVADTGNELAGRLLKRRLERTQAEDAARLAPDGKPIRVLMAAGLGKQRLYVLPQYHLVVVRFAEGAREGFTFDDREFLGRLLGFIP